MSGSIIGAESRIVREIPLPKQKLGEVRLDVVTREISIFLESMIGSEEM
jgi:hypothetical protein